MCGISFVLSLQGASKTVQVSELEQSLDIIQHRGPDGRGLWIEESGRVGLGHVRLSFLDLGTGGSQPFCDEDEGLYAAVIGELYEHEKYRADPTLQHRFKGNSDSEIVMALYKQYGLLFLSHLRGEFAIVLWDAKRELMFAATDRYCTKSLYYVVVENRLLVASEMKAFLKLGWKPKWCVESLRSHAWQFATKTVFQDVHKIPPGCYITSRNYSPELHQVKYWDSQYRDKTILETRDEESMIAGVRDHLIEAVRIRLRADVPVGIYLSGGIDSSCLAGIVAHLVKNGEAQIGNAKSTSPSVIQCFTIQFDKDSGEDESSTALHTANSLGIQCHKVQIQETDIASRFEEAVWHSEIPYRHVSGVSRFVMSEKAKAMGVKAVLTGQGSDEHFAGYKIFRPDAIQEPDQSLPGSGLSCQQRRDIYQELRKNIHMGIASDVETVTSPSTLRIVHDSLTLSELAKIGRMPFLQWTNYCRVDDPLTAFLESLDGSVRESMLDKWHPLHTSMYIWIKWFLPTVALRCVGDNVDMASHIESRFPFLDHRLNTYVNSLPPSLKMKFDPHDKSFQEKYVLREAMKPFLTTEVYSKRKKPFRGPTLFEPDGALHRLFLQLLTETNIMRLGFIDWDITRSCLQKAFVDSDAIAFRDATLIAQFVVLMLKFNVETAAPPLP